MSPAHRAVGTTTWVTRAIVAGWFALMALLVVLTVLNAVEGNWWAVAVASVVIAVLIVDEARRRVR